MKIAYIITKLSNSGGIERVLSTKVNYLADVLEYEIHIIVAGKAEKPFFPFSGRIYFHFPDMDTRNHSRREYQQKLFQKLEEVRPDITISMFGLEAEFLYKAKDGSKKLLEFHYSKNYLTHLINGIHSLKCRPLYKIKAWFIQMKKAYFASKYDKIVLLTQKDLNLWGCKSNMCFIHNPLSFRCEEKSNLELKRIIAVGRLIAQKGFDLLIDAFQLIAPDFPDWEIAIFGEGQDKQFLNNKIRQAKLEKQITIYPPSSNIKEKMLQSSLFVLPSRYEGFGLVLTEAMECGLPCIAYDCECGPSEIISNNENGILVPTGNIIQLSDAMRTLMINPSLLKKMGNESKVKVSGFYVDNVMQQWQKLFIELTK